MEQRELKEQVEALSKALQAKESTATLVAMLERMKKEVVPTEELLRVSVPYRTCAMSNVRSAGTRSLCCSTGSECLI